MYDEKSFLAGIAVGRNMKSWPRMEAPKQSVFAIVVNILSDNLKYIFNISVPSGETCLVHWGDGQTQRISSGPIEHNYAQAGMYRVLAVGSIEYILLGAFYRYQEYKIDTIMPLSTEHTGNIYIPSVLAIEPYGLVSVPEGYLANYARHDVYLAGAGDIFNNCESLRKIPDALFSGIKLAEDEYRHGLYGAFIECYSLEAIPQNLFSGADTSGITNIARLFYRAYNIAAIPTGLFDGADFSNITNAERAFAGNNIYTSIPAGLLDGFTSLESAEGMFELTQIESIPDGLFANCPVTNFKRTFYNCQHITGSVPRLWETHPNADGTECFLGCTNASNYADIPASWK